MARNMDKEPNGIPNEVSVSSLNLIKPKFLKAPVSDQIHKDDT